MISTKLQTLRWFFDNHFYYKEINLIKEQVSGSVATNKNAACYWLNGKGVKA